MPTTSVSSKSQVIIPKSMRDAHHWKPGQKLLLIDTGEGILLKSATPFGGTTLDEVAACLKYEGTAKTIENM